MKAACSFKKEKKMKAACPFKKEKRLAPCKKQQVVSANQQPTMQGGVWYTNCGNANSIGSKMPVFQRWNG
jgi:hypothetical protein